MEVETYREVQDINLHRFWLFYGMKLSNFVQRMVERGSLHYSYTPSILVIFLSLTFLVP